MVDQETDGLRLVSVPTTRCVTINISLASSPEMCCDAVKCSDPRRTYNSHGGNVDDDDDEEGKDNDDDIVNS